MKSESVVTRLNIAWSWVTLQQRPPIFWIGSCLWCLIADSTTFRSFVATGRSSQPLSSSSRRSCRGRFKENLRGSIRFVFNRNSFCSFLIWSKFQLLVRTGFHNFDFFSDSKKFPELLFLNHKYFNTIHSENLFLLIDC